MDPQPAAPCVPLAQIVGEELGLDPAQRDWLTRALNCFPLPTIRDVPRLLRAFQRISHATAWVRLDFLPRDLVEPLDALTPLVCHELAARKFGHEGSETELRGEFLFAGTIVINEEIGLPRGPEALRAVLLGCQWQWEGGDESRGSAIQTLASAIRGGRIEDALLAKLGRAATWEQFLEASDGLQESRLDTLADAWRYTFRPFLRGLTRPAGDRTSSDLPTEAPAPASPSPRPRRGDSRDEDSEAVIERIRLGTRHGSPPRPPSAPGPLEGELAEEVAPTLLTAPVPPGPRNADSRDVIRYQARQAIRSANFLLLPNHPDVLQLRDFARVVEGICQFLREASLEKDRFGASALLLQALTGRTPKTLTALDVCEDGSTRHDPRRFDLLLAEGAIRISAFWMVGEADRPREFFKPTEEQATCLEPVGRDFLLPLAPDFMDILRANAVALGGLASTHVSGIEAALRKAARDVSDRIGFEFTAGQVRASVASRLFEHCRDTAAVQLLCADTLGGSMAPLSYFAPKALTLARIHWSLQNSLLGTDAPFPEGAIGEDRVGMRLLVRVDKANAMARAPTRIMRGGVSRLVKEGRIGDVHLAMVNQLVGMLLAGATHRPGEALLQLTLQDFWIDGDVGAATFRDKTHDLAHDPRLVALPATVCRQFQAYLAHLSGLAAAQPKTAEYVQRILQGKAPLFFTVSEKGAVRPLDFKGWKAGMPEQWRDLPLNWGRHWTRTHAVEAGMRPEMVSMQLGHLEAVGYPFSGASPSEPWCFVEEAAEHWEALVRNQGWQVVHGLPVGDAYESVLPTPLRRWKNRIQTHEANHRTAAKQWRAALASRLRSNREEAEQMVLSHPEFVAAGVTALFHERKSGLPSHPLRRADFERIRDELYDSAGDDLPVAIARATAVGRIAHIVNRRTGQQSETPGPLCHFRRPLDSAFIPGMLEAVRQVHGIREHLETITGSRESWVDMASACGCVVLALAVFGGCDSPERIRGAIERRARMERSARLQDLVLVPWGDAPQQVLALRGVAAIALARLAWKRAADPVPAWDEIMPKVAQLLPGWALRDDPADHGISDLLERLCETVGVANRYELSPAARRADADGSGSTSAHVHEQLAFLDGDPAGTVHRTWETHAEVAETDADAMVVGARTGNARTQYLALCAIFPSVNRNITLPVTQQEVGSGEGASPANRRKLVDELRARLELEDPKDRLHPIVRMLTGWVIEMLENGTLMKADPALSTIETYLTRIGGALVHVFGQSSMEAVDEVDLEEAYLAAIESKSGHRQKAASAVLAFHAYASSHHGLPELDLSEVRMYLGAEAGGLADARLILPAERDAILARSATPLPREGGVMRHATRARRLAGLAMPLFAWGGLRRSEAMGLQFRDISTRGERLRVRVRPNHSRRLKTLRARRAIEIHARPEPTPEQAPISGIAEWVAIERQRIPHRHLETAFVFAQDDAPFDATFRKEIVADCLACCRDVTGRRDERLHHLRHLVAMEHTTPVFLTPADREAMGSGIRFAQVATLQGDLALPRDLHGQIVEIGHVDPDTTLRAYHHLPSLLRSRTDARLAERYVKRSILSPLLGVTLHALDWALKQRPGREKGLAWLDVTLSPREVPREGASGAIVSARASDPVGLNDSLDDRWTARGLDGLLKDIARIGSLEQALRVRGDDVAQAGALRLRIMPLEARLGRKLLEEGSARAGAPSRSIRTVRSGREMEAMLDWYDKDEGARAILGELAGEVWEFMQPLQADRIHLPLWSMAQLHNILLDLGVNSSRIAYLPDAGGLLVMRVLRPAKKEAAEGTRSYLGLLVKRTMLIIRLAGHGGPTAATRRPAVTA